MTSPVMRASAMSDSASLTADTMSAGRAARRAAQKSTSARIRASSAPGSNASVLVPVPAPGDGRGFGGRTVVGGGRVGEERLVDAGRRGPEMDAEDLAAGGDGQRAGEDEQGGEAGAAAGRQGGHRGEPPGR